MARTAVQLYSLRDIDAPLPDILDLVGETPLEGVEFALRIREDETDVDAVLDALERNDLDVAAAHVGLEDLEERYDEMVDLYGRLGCETLVVPWLDPEHFESEEAVAAAADRLEAVKSALADDGFDLHYHNHDQEFVSLGEAAAMDELLARAEIGFEIDLGWAQAGGVDPAEYVEEYADRISLAHFADADGETMECVELGAGDLDLEAVTEAVARADVEWYIYEHDNPENPRESLENGAETLESLR
ncbi:sugar phosphate isomerase/epimerase [Natronolimnobius sp. AArcel1]|uniref:sugar phosphate isomerase/epimerase family protein n=1 Tax=Natronolimnobius sp. AArcel1 TaxID=1679093 RepID=UPI0013EC67F4|nr:sugar phosphate isomerase/epimerase [Natronolimnobius sp. AArcel1]NGM67941.1 sugar phosphate isomerase/epimerase [Natronolimnobius sp. AArcel1]